MKKFIYGFILSTAITMIYMYGGNTIDFFRGPTIHKRAELLYSNSISVLINPETKEEMPIVRPKYKARFFYDVKENQKGWVTWKENNLAAWDIEYHLGGN